MLQPRIQKAPLLHSRKPDPTKAPDHKALVKKCPCIVCSRPAPSDPHHLRGAFIDGRPTGISRKDDRWMLPFCRACHDDTHHDGDLEGWLVGHGIDQ